MDAKARRNRWVSRLSIPLALESSGFEEPVDSNPILEYVYGHKELGLYIDSLRRGLDAPDS